MSSTFLDHLRALFRSLDTTLSPVIRSVIRIKHLEFQDALGTALDLQKEQAALDTMILGTALIETAWKEIPKASSYIKVRCRELEFRVSFNDGVGCLPDPHSSRIHNPLDRKGIAGCFGERRCFLRFV